MLGQRLTALAAQGKIRFYREVELKHGRVAMLASLGFLVGESGFTPLFEGKIDGIAINQATSNRVTPLIIASATRATSGSSSRLATSHGSSSASRATFRL